MGLYALDSTRSPSASCTYVARTVRPDPPPLVARVLPLDRHSRHMRQASPTQHTRNADVSRQRRTACLPAAVLLTCDMRVDVLGYYVRVHASGAHFCGPTGRQCTNVVGAHVRLSTPRLIAA